MHLSFSCFEFCQILVHLVLNLYNNKETVIINLNT